MTYLYYNSYDIILDSIGILTSIFYIPVYNLLFSKKFKYREKQPGNTDNVYPLSLATGILNNSKLTKQWN